MKTFVLNHLSIVFQQVHAQLQMLASINILCHNAVIGPVEQDFSKKFNRLTLGHVRVRLDQNPVVLLKKHIEIDVQELGDELFVLRK